MLNSIIEHFGVSSTNHRFLQTATAIGTDLAACEAFAALFDNTCTTSDGPLAALDDHTGETMTCIDGETNCMDGSGKETFTAEYPCTW
jgi:hypothetical protein